MICKWETFIALNVSLIVAIHKEMLTLQNSSEGETQGVDVVNDDVMCSNCAPVVPLFCL